MTITGAALADLKARMPCHQVAAKWVKLRKVRGKDGEFWTGPCPLCSRDRAKKATKFKATDRRWMCAACMDGGDVIELVRKVENKSFTEAVDWLGGVQDIDQAEAERRKAELDAKAAASDKAGAEFREREKNTAREMWSRGIKPEGSSVERYLALRGLEDAPVFAFRCIEAMPYYDGGKKDAPIVHRGPAMLAAFSRNDEFCGLHITYLDLDQPKGKLKLPPDDDDEDRPAKKMRGSKAGAGILLVPPRAGAPVLRAFIGEGSETVLSVWCALNAAGQLSDHDAFYMAGDLGNLGGKSRESVTHPTLKNAAGRARRVPGPWPDFESPGIELPRGVTEVIILGDGDSDPFTTRCALARASLRFAADGRKVVVAMSPEGSDYNDIWRANRDAAAICALIEAAAPLTPDDVMAAVPAPPRAPNSAAKTSGARQRGRSSSPSAEDEPPPWDDNPPAAAAAVAPPSAQAEESGPSQMGEFETKLRRPGARSANRARWDGPPNKYGEGEAGLNRWLSTFPMTELGLIERYVQRQKHRLMHCEAIGWLVWTGKLWSRVGAREAAVSAGHEVVRAIQDEAEAIRDDNKFDFIIAVKPGKKKDDDPIEIWLSDALESFGRESETKAKMTLHEHASAYLSVQVDQLDADPFAINIQNGTLLVRPTWDDPLPRGWCEVNRYIRLKPHEQDDLITKIMPVKFNQAAECPVYDAFMETVQPDAEVRDFLDDWNGYSLTGDASEQRLVFHYGTGKNGKSTELALRLALVGDYGRSIPIETFADQGKPRSAGQATPDLAMLRRVRMLATSEPEKGWKLNEGLIKNLTGGDEMAVRELHRAYFMLKPEFKFSIVGNFKPNIGGGEADSGMWRRMTLVNWAVKIPPERRDKHLLDKMKLEGSGVFNRWLAGLSRWMGNGLRLPEQVAKSTEEFRVDSDPLGRFLATCTEALPGDRVGSTDLYNVFDAWRKSNGEAQWAHKGFSKAMGDRGYEKTHSNGRFFLGLRLIRTAHDFAHEHDNPSNISESNDGLRNDVGYQFSEEDDVPL